MSFQSDSITIDKFEKCDILIGQNDIEKYGFPKDKTIWEMVALAQKYKCPIIVKAGKNAKWYLKGKCKEVTFLRETIQHNIGNYPNGFVCYLITQK
jgi:hypothetical protein